MNHCMLGRNKVLAVWITFWKGGGRRVYIISLHALKAYSLIQRHICPLLRSINPFLLWRNIKWVQVSNAVCKCPTYKSKPHVGLSVLHYTASHFSMWRWTVLWPREAVRTERWGNGPCQLNPGNSPQTRGSARRQRGHGWHCVRHRPPYCVGGGEKASHLGCVFVGKLASPYQVAWSERGWHSSC